MRPALVRALAFQTLDLYEKTCDVRTLLLITPASVVDVEKRLLRCHQDIRLVVLSEARA